MAKTKSAIKKRKKELAAILELIPEDKKSIASDLIEEIVFMSETLEKLKDTIREEGTIELFEQGKQSFYRESPSLKSYNTTIQKYGAIYKQLIDLMPKQTAKPEGEDDGFEKGREDRND